MCLQSEKCIDVMFFFYFHAKLAFPWNKKVFFYFRIEICMFTALLCTNLLGDRLMVLLFLINSGEIQCWNFYVYCTTLYRFTRLPIDSAFLSDKQRWNSTSATRAEHPTTSKMAARRTWAMRMRSTRRNLRPRNGRRMSSRRSPRRNGCTTTACESTASKWSRFCPPLASSSTMVSCLWF